MRTIQKAAVFALVTAAIAVFSGPSFAQQLRQPRLMSAAPASGLNAYAAAPSQSLSSSGIGADSSQVPGFIAATPDKCWINDGYGRWSTCDGGS